MEQRCHLSMVWLTWLGLPLLAVIVGVRTGVTAGLAVLAVGVIGQVLYIRAFPGISRSMGYGSVADMPAAAVPAGGTFPDVTFYTASVCPFCPIVRRRLAELQQENRFAVREIDVTFRPHLVRAKGLRSVPVLEANGQFLVGNATTAQIAAFLANCSVGLRPASRVAERYIRHVEHLLESVGTSAGESSPEIRGAIRDRANQIVSAGSRFTVADTIPPTLSSYLHAVLSHAYRITDEDVQTLKAVHTEDFLFETTVTAAVHAGVARLERALAVFRGERP